MYEDLRPICDFEFSQPERGSDVVILCASSYLHADIMWERSQTNNLLQTFQWSSGAEDMMCVAV